VSSELQKWLSWKIDTHEVYFGTGDGLVSAPVKLAKNLAGVHNGRKDGPAAAAQDRPEGERRRSLVREIGSRVLGLMIATERRRKVLKANRLRLNGAIIVADRYPQNQFAGINDGPRVRAIENEAPRVGRFLARRELNIYDRIEEFAPDIVVKLHVPVEVARTRKPDHSIEEIRRKAEITDSLAFPHSQVIDIDASKPLDCVLLTVKKRVWNSL
jgi:thymidylate kinase